MKRKLIPPAALSGGLAFAVGFTWACPAAAAVPQLDGARLGLAWMIPFAGLLLSIALAPQLAHRFWNRNFGKVALGWSLVLVAPMAAIVGVRETAGELLRAALLDYLPFIALLVALFVIAGGVRVRGGLGGTPLRNTGVLAAGALLASVMGTTGAAMLLVRPLILANEARRRSAHVLVFFIFLVGNIGGGLTPIGDPPLFLGFLRGVTFGWTLAHMAAPVLVTAAVVLGAGLAVDAWLWRRDGAPAQAACAERFGVEGGRNLVYLALAVAAVLLTGVWRPGTMVTALGVRIPLESVARDAALAALALLSFLTTPQQVRIENAFTWEPLAEVVWLFAGVFVTILPVLAILQAGTHGALAPLVGLATGPDGRPHVAAYFWLTGLLSSTLDNAPTYLVFFQMAGGDGATLMAQGAQALTAISAGAVFMGALTYVGNAPNFMIRAIAIERGVRMPSFFAYIGWAAAVLLPAFALDTVLFFRPA